MMCPKCNKLRLTYIIPRVKRPEGGWRRDVAEWKSREDFRVKCPDCKYEGIEY